MCDEEAQDEQALDVGEILSEIWERGDRDGIETLSPTERDLFLIWDCILHIEMESISGYFYNLLPERYEEILETVAAMRRRGLKELAALLGEAAELFRDYADPEVETTWENVLRHYDPDERLDAIEKSMLKLDWYGLEGIILT